MQQPAIVVILLLHVLEVIILNCISHCVILMCESIALHTGLLIFGTACQAILFLHLYIEPISQILQTYNHFTTFISLRLSCVFLLCLMYLYVSVLYDLCVQTSCINKWIWIWIFKICYPKPVIQHTQWHRYLIPQQAYVFLLNDKNAINSVVFESDVQEN